MVETSSLGISPAEPAVTVYGQWAIPEIFPVAGPVAGDPSTPLTVGFWVVSTASPTARSSRPG